MRLGGPADLFSISSAFQETENPIPRPPSFHTEIQHITQQGKINRFFLLSFTGLFGVTIPALMSRVCVGRGWVRRGTPAWWEGRKEGGQEAAGPREDGGRMAGGFL